MKRSISFLLLFLFTPSLLHQQLSRKKPFSARKNAMSRSATAKTTYIPRPSPPLKDYM